MILLSHWKNIQIKYDTEYDLKDLYMFCAVVGKIGSLALNHLVII